MNKITFDTGKRCMYCGEKHLITMRFSETDFDTTLEMVKRGAERARGQILKHKLDCYRKHREAENAKLQRR